MIDFKELWIRKDREEYFLGGVIITCVIASFLSVYWHFSDRIPPKKFDKGREKQFYGARPAPRHPSGFSPYLYPGATGRQTTTFYRLGEETIMAVPEPEFNTEP